MDIKIFVCCHLPVEVPQHPLLVPLQVGAALAKERFPGFLYDDTGDNISAKNRSYCELTGQYWAWKNVDADYYGFFHYRRYLYPNPLAKRPYRIEKGPTLGMLNRVHFADAESLIPNHDLILPKGENMHVSVQEHYNNAPFHHQKDLELIKEILRQQHPEYKMAMNVYLNNPICYFGNIFIMKREQFQNYCNWLFPLLNEFDHQADVTGYSVQDQRVDGYLAERLLGIYASAHRAELQVVEWPRMHFEKDDMQRYGQRALLFLFPPGSYRRAKVKQWLIPKSRKNRKYG